MILLVFVSKAVLEELKKIIRDSKIMGYLSPRSQPLSRFPFSYYNDHIIVVMTPSGPSPMPPAPRSSRSSSTTSTSPSPYSSPFFARAALESYFNFKTCQIGAVAEALKCEDPEGLKNFYYTIQDLRLFVFALVAMHFKIKPVPI
jgi:hypothetical protein